MATMIFLTLCIAGEGFLVYALVHFVRESKRRHAGAKVAVLPYSVAAYENRATGGEGRRVIPITVGKRELHQNASDRKAC